GQPDLVAGDSVHDLIVDRGADGAGVTVVAIERRSRARRLHLTLGDSVKLRCADPWLGRRSSSPEHPSDHQAGLAHQCELARSLDLDRRYPAEPHCPTASLNTPYP